MTIVIADMMEQDWPAVRAIYEEGIATGIATFEAQAPTTWHEWHQNKIAECSIVARDEDRVVGWATLQPVWPRSCYGGVAEVSVYVTASARGTGIGTLLLHELIHRSERRGIWTLQASVMEDNVASLRLHERCGFRVVGRRERLAKAVAGPFKGLWRDVFLLERRSEVVGKD